MQKGDRFVAGSERRPADRLFIEVTRVAVDNTWADIKVCNWAVMWTKRQKLEGERLPGAVPLRWDRRDIDAQQVDLERKWAEQFPPVSS